MNLADTLPSMFVAAAELFFKPLRGVVSLMHATGLRVSILVILCCGASLSNARAQATNRLDQHIRDMMTDRFQKPVREEFVIEWREINALPGHFQWHMGDTLWGVRLHPTRWEMDKLNKKTKYKVDGVALDQNYSVIEVWAYSVEKFVPAKTK